MTDRANPSKFLSNFPFKVSQAACLTKTHSRLKTLPFWRVCCNAISNTLTKLPHAREPTSKLNWSRTGTCLSESTRDEIRLSRRSTTRFPNQHSNLMGPQTLKSLHFCQSLLFNLKFANKNIACTRPQIDQSTGAHFWRSTLKTWVRLNHQRPLPSADFKETISTTSSRCQSPSGPSLFPDIGASRNPSKTDFTPPPAGSQK